MDDTKTKSCAEHKRLNLNIYPNKRLLKRVENWRKNQSPIPPVATACRQLIELGLSVDGPEQGRQNADRQECESDDNAKAAEWQYVA
jgi:hypothetical protein